MSKGGDNRDTDWGQYWLDFFHQIGGRQRPDAPPIESYFHPPNPPQDEQSAEVWVQYWADLYEKISAGQKADAPPLEWHFTPLDSPEGEQPAAPDPELAAVCRAEMIAMTEGFIKWEAELFTYSEKWGVVWRADFWQTNRNQYCPTRVIRWRTMQGGLGTTLSNRKNPKLELAP